MRALSLPVRQLFVPPLYVTLAAESLPGFPLFDARDESGWAASELTARQVDDVARRRGLKVVPVVDSAQLAPSPSK
jgi:hypothetical protein